MRNTFLTICLALSCWALNSCSSENSAAQNPTLDLQLAKSFLDSINGKFSEQIATSDSAALASHYWSDAELLLDNNEVIKGNDILHTWGLLIRMGVKEMKFSTTDIKGSPTLMIETGNYEMKDGVQSLIDRGKYVVVWEKRNDEWKLYRDIGCTSLPPAK